MNTATNTAAIVATTETANVSSNKTTAKKSNSKRVTKAITVGLNHGEVAAPENLLTFTFDLGNFTKSVSDLCQLITWSVTFELLNVKMSLKPLRKTNDNVFRAYDIFKQVAAAIFGSNDLETIVKFDAASREQLILTNLYQKGFKFSSCSKKSVLNQIDTKEKVKREALKNIMAHDKENMQKEIALIAALKEDTKATNEKNGVAIGKFTLKFAAEISQRNSLQIATYSAKS